MGQLGSWSTRMLISDDRRRRDEHGGAGACKPARPEAGPDEADEASRWTMRVRRYDEHSRLEASVCWWRRASSPAQFRPPIVVRYAARYAMGDWRPARTMLISNRFFLHARRCTYHMRWPRSRFVGHAAASCVRSTAEPCAPGCDESLSAVLSPSDESILYWCWTHHNSMRTREEEKIKDAVLAGEEVRITPSGTRIGKRRRICGWGGEYRTFMNEVTDMARSN